MRICLAQVESVRGEIEENIHRHMHWIDQAVLEGADLVVFPELSLTGYEPTLAGELALAANDSRLNVFSAASEKFKITISVGLPLLQNGQVTIGMLVYQPDIPVITYSKQQLHEDEKPYFYKGKEQYLFRMGKNTIAPAICYEALQEDHLVFSIGMGAELYMTSVAKDCKGVKKAQNYFSEASKKYKVPITMVNAVGRNDGFHSCGGSAVWNSQGELLSFLGKEEGLLFQDVS